MEDIQCIFCDKGSDRVVIEENGYKGRKCPQCGLIFVSPRPTLSEILNLYSHNQAHLSAEMHLSGEFTRRLYARHNLAVIKRYGKGGSLLEIGTGAGYFLDEARKEGFEVYGIELNKIQANFVKNTLSIPCQETPLDESSFGGRRFDIIYHCDVLSHFYDPIAEFKKINRKSKDGGMLVFETGNLGDVDERHFSAFTEFYYPDHLFFFGENNLKELLKLTRFELVKKYKYCILAQLLISKASKRATDFIKSLEGVRSSAKFSTTKAQPSSTGESGSDHPNKKAHGRSKVVVISLVSFITRYFLYLLRYNIGYVMPKKGRPQTVIVIAQKT